MKEKIKNIWIFIKPQLFSFLTLLATIVLLSLYLTQPIFEKISYQLAKFDNRDDKVRLVVSRLTSDTDGKYTNELVRALQQTNWEIISLDREMPIKSFVETSGSLEEASKIDVARVLDDFNAKILIMGSVSAKREKVQVRIWPRDMSNILTRAINTETDWYQQIYRDIEKLLLSMYEEQFVLPRRLKDIAYAGEDPINVTDLESLANGVLEFVEDAQSEQIRKRGSSLFDELHAPIGYLHGDISRLRLAERHFEEKMKSEYSSLSNEEKRFLEMNLMDIRQVIAVIQLNKESLEGISDSKVDYTDLSLLYDTISALEPDFETQSIEWRGVISIVCQNSVMIRETIEQINSVVQCNLDESLFDCPHILSRTAIALNHVLPAWSDDVQRIQRSLYLIDGWASLRYRKRISHWTDPVFYAKYLLQRRLGVRNEGKSYEYSHSEFRMLNRYALSSHERVVTRRFPSDVLEQRLGIGGKYDSAKGRLFESRFGVRFNISNPYPFYDSSIDAFNVEDHKCSMKSISKNGVEDIIIKDPVS